MTKVKVSEKFSRPLLLMCLNLETVEAVFAISPLVKGVETVQIYKEF